MNKVLNIIIIIAVLILSAAMIIPLIFLVGELISDRKNSILYEIFSHGNHYDNKAGG